MYPGVGFQGVGCSGLDPFEDTESARRTDRPARPARSCSGLDPFEDTESRLAPAHQIDQVQRCSGLDPFEDTESLVGKPQSPLIWSVAAASIRLRILKVERISCDTGKRKVAAASIRLRILKAQTRRRPLAAQLVAAASIRLRILKASCVAARVSSHTLQRPRSV